jgi:hypothetical protein
LSHSRFDSREAVAVKAWLIEQEPGLDGEIYLDLDPHTGIRPGERWKDALNRAATRCEAVICLLSQNWLNSAECLVEFRYAENLHKAILCARLESVPDGNITSEWQRCDLFGDHGSTTEVDIADGGEPVVFDSAGLQRLLNGLRALGIGAEHFPWPPPDDPDRAPYRGWAPLEEVDAAVFFGRDAQILRGLDALHGMRSTGVESLFVILGPSGAGKSSFLRAGLLPRLRRDDRRFLLMPIVRPERAVLTGERGLAHAIHRLRSDLGLLGPMLGEIKNACHPEHVEQIRSWLEEARQVVRERLLDVVAEQPAPTLVLPVDQAEELFNADAGDEAPRFLELLASLVQHEAGVTPAMIVAVTIRADRYEPLQIAPELTGVDSGVFDQLKPMPSAGHSEVITGPARRASAEGQRLTVEPALVERLLGDADASADALPLLALTLERLYHDFGNDGDLTLAEYESMGGMAQVVQTEIETVLGTDPQRQAHLDMLHDAFIPWLATINPGNDQPMRRVARWADLPEPSRPLIDALVARRLMVKDIRNDEVVLEVALESLLRQWDDLDGWLRDERKNLKTADDIERNAADWKAHDNDRTWLLTGSRLIDAEKLANTAGFRDRLAKAHDYLAACRDAENLKVAAEEEFRQAQLRRADERARNAELQALRAEKARREADERQRQAEVQAAREREEAAAALVAAQQRATLEAQQHAEVLRNRARVLRAALFLVVIVAVVAVGAFVQALQARRQADISAREATAYRLTTEAALTLSNSRPGTDVQAIQKLLAAQAIGGQTVAPLTRAATTTLGQGRTPADLCAKLTVNMSHKQWNDWVSPDIEYIKACPDLPIAPD